MKTLKIFLLVIIVILLIIFCTINRSLVLLDLFPLPYYIELPIFLFFILSIAIGVFLGWIFAIVKYFHV